MANKLSSLFESPINGWGAWGSVVYTYAIFLFTSALGPLSSGTVKSGIGSNDIIHELTDGLLVLAVGLKRYIR
jgi:hypothetical protein